MLASCHYDDEVWNRDRFIADEVRYNLMHRICESSASLCLKEAGGGMIFAWSQGRNAWLWIAADASGEEKTVWMRELAERLSGANLQGVIGDPQTAEAFASLYAAASRTGFRQSMRMEAYACPAVNRPSSVPGTLVPAEPRHAGVVAEFLAGFSEGAHGGTLDPSSRLPAARSMIEAGYLYLWMAGGEPVSMAQIAHRSRRHGRINAVYTVPSQRKNGFASAITAELCLLLQREGLTPMLYADMDNPDSNKVYRNIGFIGSGQVADIRFG
ncbi:GNAT family N-acetyltransferase [Paenibacillus humicola]|uniref:GNAT family N-acetyltransferase n=1 Tax=Paenibacillus humicola TaxID=3110540 RepID=UPI00237BE732|nr:GNAT family N-acetyltransferase [Paenibacillus humicola]